MAESEGLEKQDKKIRKDKKDKVSAVARLRSYLGLAVVLTVVFGGSALVGAHVRGAKEHQVKVPAGAAGDEKLALPVHPTVPVRVVVYEDLRSPQSKAFAQEYAAVIAKLLASGQMEIDYRLTTGSDARYGGTGAKAAANAAACAQDEGRFREYVDELWKLQPADPQQDVFADVSVLKHAGKMAGKLSSGKFVPCVEGGDHDGWVRRSQDRFAALALGDAPVVQINDGTPPDPATLTPAAFRTLVQKAAKEVVKQAATATPSPSGSAGA